MTLETALTKLKCALTKLKLTNDKLKLANEEKVQLKRENQQLRNDLGDVIKELKKAEEVIRNLSGGGSWYSNRKKKESSGTGTPEDQKKRRLREVNQRRGAKPGHRPNNRAIKEADQHLHLKLTHCPNCHHEITGQQSERYRRQVIELTHVPLIQIHEYHFYQVHCPHCQKTVSTGIGNIPELKRHQYIGNRLKALLCVLKHELNCTIAQAQQLINFMAKFNFKDEVISKGEVAETYLEVVDYGRKSYEELLEKIRSCPYSYWDETGLSCGGSRGYAWLGRTNQEAYYRVELSRGSKVVRGSLGSSYDGAIVSDFYSGYQSKRLRVQRCWVHLLRAIERRYEAEPYNKELRHLREKLKWMYRTFTDEGFRKKLAEDVSFGEQEYEHYVEWLKKLINYREYRSKSCLKIINLLKKHLEEMFLFLKVPGMQPHNNMAENTLRAVVRYRDGCNGVQSERGMKAFSIGKSLAKTYELRGDNQFETFLNLLTPA